MAKSKGRRPNPSFKFGLFPKEVETRNGAIKTKVGITQSFPPRSRLFFQKQVALGIASIDDLKKEKLHQDLLLRLEKKFFELRFLFQKRDVLDENFKLLDSWIKLWETHYSHHDFQYQRLIQLQVDAREIEDQIRSVDDSIPVVYRELMELAWLEPLEVQKPLFHEKVSDLSLELSLDANIDLLLIEASLKKQGFRIDLAKSFFKPKMRLGTEFTQIDSSRVGPTQGEDAWMISLGVEWVIDKQRVRDQVSAANFSHQALLSTKDYKTRDLQVQWERASFAVNDARKQFQLTKDDLIPRTREALDSIQANYITRSKGIDFFSLLGHLRKLLELSLAMELHTKEYFQARAVQKRILGIIEEN